MFTVQRVTGITSDVRNAWTIACAKAKDSNQIIKTLSFKEAFDYNVVELWQLSSLRLLFRCSCLLQFLYSLRFSLILFCGSAVCNRPPCSPCSVGFDYHIVLSLECWTSQTSQWPMNVLAKIFSNKKKTCECANRNGKLTCSSFHTICNSKLVCTIFG